MSRLELKQDIVDYLSRARMMHLATSNDGKPWVCNVWFANDADLNIYWVSSTKRRHSNAIAENPNVAASMCLPREPSESDLGALQMEGTAVRLSSASEVAKAIKLFAKRGIFSVSQIKQFMKDIDHPHRFYKIAPSKIVLFSPSKPQSTQEYIVNDN